MTQLSAHFTQADFERDATLPAECVEPYRRLAEDILEPVFAIRPVTVTSGYRPPEANAAAHGVPHSQHIATANWCAADIHPADGNVAGPTVTALYDAIRASNIPFDRCGLEWNRDETRYIIHLSWSRTPPRGTCFRGPEGGPYVEVPRDDGD